MVQLTDKYWAVEVPEDAQDFIIKPRYVNAQECGVLIWFDYRGASAFSPIAHTDFDFLFTTQGATEEDARKVVEVFNAFGSGDLYKDYSRQYMWINKATQSLQSLLKSKGCDTEKNYAILKNTNNDTAKK